MVLRAHLVGQGPGQRQAALGKLVRHAVFAYRDFNFHARVIDLTQHFLDAPHRLSKQGWRLYQLDHHHLADFGDTGGALGNQHILPVAFVFRRHQPDPTLLQQPSDDGLAGTFHDFHHAPFGSALAVTAHDANLDPVFVQDGAHFIGRQIDIGRAVITCDKTMAITMALNDTFHFIQQAAGLA